MATKRRRFTRGSRVIVQVAPHTGQHGRIVAHQGTTPDGEPAYDVHFDDGTSGGTFLESHLTREPKPQEA